MLFNDDIAQCDDYMGPCGKKSEIKLKIFRVIKKTHQEKCPNFYIPFSKNFLVMPEYLKKRVKDDPAKFL